jgi:tetratricopeptide (TPR) repeat protein
VRQLINILIEFGGQPRFVPLAGQWPVFFFAAAIVVRCAHDTAQVSKSLVVTTARLRLATTTAFVFALMLLGGMSIQAVSATLHGAAQRNRDRVRAQQLYQASLRWNPYDPATHYNYGIFLLIADQPARAVPHLRYAAKRGFNSSVCYGYLITAEARAGAPAAAALTAAQAVNVYPQSVFLLVRHAGTLHDLGQTEEAARQYGMACAIDERMARGWWQLISFGLEKATKAAREDSSIALPGELVFRYVRLTVLDNKKRLTLAFDTHPSGL